MYKINPISNHSKAANNSLNHFVKEEPAVTSAYLNNILVPSDLGHIIDEIHGELESLQANESTHGDRFKKLKGHDNLYSLRLSNTARLLFLHINGILILVDKFEKHGEYERKLKKHKLAEHYLKHFGITSDISNIELYEEIEEEKSSELASHLLGIERPQLQVAELNLSNIVIFDETQLSINLNKANIVVGMPGSGKTSVAARLCGQAYKEVLNQHQAFSEETNYEIAYVTENKQLAIKVQDFFALLDQRDPNVLLKSYDYASFAKRMCPDALENKEEKRETDFISWCHDKQLYKEKSFKEKILSTIELSKKREQRSEQLKELYSRIYTEFKIISAFTEESDYTHAGKKKSLLTDDSEVKAYLFKLYQSYISSFGEESYDLNFFDINANKSANDTPDIIFADECQLGSYRMFEGLMQMCKSPQNVHFFGDTHQNIYGATPFDTFIESLWNTYEIKGKKTSLNASYRIPEAVLPVANALLLLKNYSYGSQSKDSYTSLQLSKEISQTGSCHLWEKKSLGESQQILTSLCESANTAIVTNDPGQIEHIKSSYGTSLVFTPDQILGQEFSTIISIEPFSAPIFRSIENHCSGALSHQPTSHYPKKSDNKVISKEAVATLNTAYVTLIRAQTQLFIIYSQQELVMVDYLRQKISLKSQHQHSSVIEESDGKSAEAWRKRAEHLKKDGNIDLADEIMNGKDCRKLTLKNRKQILK